MQFWGGWGDGWAGWDWEVVAGELGLAWSGGLTGAVRRGLALNNPVKMVMEGLRHFAAHLEHCKQFSNVFRPHRIIFH